MARPHRKEYKTSSDTPWGRISVPYEKRGRLGWSTYWNFAPKDWDGKFDRQNPPEWIRDYLIGFFDGDITKLRRYGVDYHWLVSKEFNFAIPRAGSRKETKMIVRYWQINPDSDTNSPIYKEMFERIESKDYKFEGE